MLIKYYNDNELAYANRKRYKNFNFVPFYEEHQKSVLLGDGANTQIKTSKKNICNYVTIDNTRWFVTSYVYQNGGQITLFLQRDVVGEFGIEDCYGKVERGYTDTLLKYRKELSLNEILKQRIPLKPNSNIYGNYYLQSIDNNDLNIHNNEMWGILYLTKPAEGQTIIPIPAFAPETVDYNFIENGTAKNESVSSFTYFSFAIKTKNTNRYYFVNVKYLIYGINTFKYSLFVSVENFSGKIMNPIRIDLSSWGDSKEIELTTLKILFEDFFNYGIHEHGADFHSPDIPRVEENIPNYDNITIKVENKYYNYTMSDNIDYIYGSANVESLFSALISYLPDCNIELETDTIGIDYNIGIKVNQKIYNCVELSADDAGELIIDTTKQQLIDEPYYILAFPLFDTVIKCFSNGSSYNINRLTAFNIFNTIIQTLSGENGYLIDAQVYPYCPILTNVNAEIKGYPFFTINSTCYEHDCFVNLYPNSDIKKEYMERTYSIVSPEQSGKTSFNFYDYVNEVINIDGGNKNINYKPITIKIKTALKPFGIISSAVIIPTNDSLKGITYNSDLRGCQPSGNGFECSLSSNAFETYKRQNSNYQQIFSLQKDELVINQETERINEITAGIVNTVSATAMGTIAGGSIGDTGIFGNSVGTKAVSAGVGGATALATVGTAMAVQYNQNEKLREFEKNLQQQSFDLQIGTIKNLPNSINRVSGFNEIILKDFWYIIEIYECSDYEKQLINDFIVKYSYGIGIYSYVKEFHKNGWFLRSTLITSNYLPNLHLIAEKELMGGIYYYE